MVLTWVDNCKFTPTAGGTTDWTYSSAASGYQSPAAAGITNGATYNYFAISTDLTQWELGKGAYNTGTGVLSRTTVLYNSSGTGTATGQSGAGTKISFSSAPMVALVALAEDLLVSTTLNQFEYSATAGQTTFSGTDQNGATLAYTVGFVQVFVNGYKVNKADYTATDGTSVVIGSAAALGDLITIVAFSVQSVANALVPSNNLSDLQSATSARQNLGLPSVLRSHLAGFTLSTAGSSATFSVAAGSAGDSTNADFITLAAAISKTTSAWALGTAAGALDVGTIANTTWYHAHAIKRPDTSWVEVMVSLAPGAASTVTITNASPGVVSWAANGLQANTPVVFTSTGTLPTGLTAGTQYYVKTVVSVDTFTVSATQGGTAINTSSAGSGTHTATSNPILANANAAYTLFRRLGSLKTNGSAQWVKFIQDGDLFIWDTPVADVSVVNPGTAAVTRTLSVPLGVRVEAQIFAGAIATNSSTDLPIAIYISDLSTADLTPAFTGASSVEAYAPGITTSMAWGGQVRVMTSTASQIRSRLQQSTAGTTLGINTSGWRDTRGRDS